ncbi:hypothetical protein GON26_01350 [Flavobacterium sp. GA093]|uniref:Uncharacterized protein n=1 Tax=Flavobacterium hydrocarbonoxydans TaxID=2683249 RepID=A0A6I4NK90_9FLAO|nr:hypothetical protein [Flavobacterium hydrocarbonoxydans]MWB92995.1 hypothetical protein [Flavobacterium hydrocarbonoxydans]
MKAKQGQSFCDLVIQGTGNIENAVEMAILNNLSITDNLSIDQVLMPAGKENKSILEIWSEYNLPATALTDENLSVIIPDEGIGAMIIEDTFIIR